MQASIMAWVVTYWLHSTILVLGAWLLERRWGDRPERMSAVWKTALVGGVLTATLQTGLEVAPAGGQWTLASETEAAPVPARVEAVVPRETRETVVARAERPVFEVLASAPVPSEVPLAVEASWPPHDWVVQPESRERERDEAPVLVSASATTTSSTTSPPSVSASAEPSAWAAAVPWILAVLGLGALLGLASVLLAFAALRRQLAGRSEAEGRLPALLEGLRRRAGLARAVPLTMAPRVRVPMAVGVLRPEIVVPPQAAQALPPAHQESLLAHELAHVLRRDPSWRLVALLAERVLFFQPLNRLASSRIAQAAEYLCDDWAARHTQKPLALASCLTEIAGWVARPGPVPVTMAGPRSILGRRVQRLLQPARASARPWWLTLALGVPLVAVVAVAPGVEARTPKPSSGRSEPAEIVVIDEEGRRHEVVAPKGGAVVVKERGGKLHVEPLDGDEARRAGLVESDGPGETARAQNKARRQARKELRQAFRAAKKRGEAVPSQREVAAILRRAQGQERSVATTHGPEHLEVRVVVPGEISVHGRLPLDLEALEALEALEGLEELGPLLEQIQAELDEAGLDVVMRRHAAESEPELRIRMAPDPELMRRDVERARHDAARARQEAARARRDAEQHLRERDARHPAGPSEHELERIQRDSERIRREVERAHRERRHRAPSSELPTVWNYPAPGVPRPPMPGAASAPRAPLPPPPGAALAPPRPPMPGAASAPAAPLPFAPRPPAPALAPRAPAAAVGPVVWVRSLPSPAAEKRGLHA